MIQANELRVGNCLLNAKGQIGKVKEIIIGDAGHDYKHFVRFSDLVYGGYLENLQPIPLTPEILEKCGFNNLNFPGDSYFSLIKRPKENYYDVLLVPDDANLGVRLLYLHQLQNLYFALTGEELILKL